MTVTPTHCPAEVTRIVTHILSAGLLALRLAPQDMEPVLARYCWVEANHLHNLPELLGSFTLDLLYQYLEHEVPFYKEEVAPLLAATHAQSCGQRVLARHYEPLWAELRAWQDGPGREYAAGQYTGGHLDNELPQSTRSADHA